MPILEVYVDDMVHARLQEIARELGRTAACLAESAIGEAVLNEIRRREGRTLEGDRI